MKANELRVNQTYILPDGYNRLPSGVTTLSEGDLWVILEYGLAEDVQPIPLTEEVLFKCGFKLHSKYSFWNYVLDNHFCLSMWVEETQVAGFEKKGSFYWGERLKEIKYLHELQNLLFALHGIELILNQDK